MALANAVMNHRMRAHSRPSHPCRTSGGKLKRKECEKKVDNLDPRAVTRAEDRPHGDVCPSSPDRLCWMALAARLDAKSTRSSATGHCPVG